MNSQVSQSKFKRILHWWFSDVKFFNCIVAVLASVFLAFGLYNVHSISKVTEGGVLGLVLLLEYWFKISPSVSSFVLNTACYILGAKVLGKSFVTYSIISTISFSSAYAVFEQFEPIYPPIADMPLLASIVGAIFVGVGAGFCVRVGAATGGDDAFAMSIAKITHKDIQWIYLLSDISVLLLSLSYIPLNRIVYSFLTVILSGQIVGIIQKVGTKSKEKKEKKRLQDKFKDKNKKES